MTLYSMPPAQNVDASASVIRDAFDILNNLQQLMNSGYFAKKESAEVKGKQWVSEKGRV